MRSDDPANPLYWVEEIGKRLVKLADDSLLPGSLKSSDAEQMRYLRQETETLTGLLFVRLQGLSQTNPETALPMALWISKLLEDALMIGLIAPVTSESAKAAIGEGRARCAREGKERTERAESLRGAFRAALPDDWEERPPWTLAGQMKKKMDDYLPKGVKGISQQSIYTRLSKALKEPR